MAKPGRPEGVKTLITWLSTCDTMVISRMNELFAYVSSRSPSMFIGYQTHMEMNRYDDFMCFDRNRVHLEDGGGQQYIHANEIQLPNVHYVLAQAPLVHTIVDFWRMVFQLKSNVIVALSEPVNAAEQFCSTGGNDVRRCGPLYSLRGVVNDTHTNEKWKTVDEELSAKNAQSVSSRFVLFKQWQNDKALPPVADLVALVRDIKTQADAMHSKVYGAKTATLKKQPPIVAVCSTGAIRCGLLAAVDSVVRSVDTKTEINVGSVVRTLRDCRYGSMGTFDQYIYIYMAVAEAARQKQVPRADQAFKRLNRIFERLQNPEAK